MNKEYTCDKIKELISQVNPKKKVSNLSQKDKLLLVDYLCGEKFDTYKDLKQAVEDDDGKYWIDEYIDFLKDYPGTRLLTAILKYEHHESMYWDSVRPEIERLVEKDD